MHWLASDDMDGPDVDEMPNRYTTPMVWDPDINLEGYGGAIQIPCWLG